MEPHATGHMAEDLQVVMAKRCCLQCISVFLQPLMFSNYFWWHTLVVVKFWAAGQCDDQGDCVVTRKLDLRPCSNKHLLCWCVLDQKQHGCSVHTSPVLLSELRPAKRFLPTQLKGLLDSVLYNLFSTGSFRYGSTNIMLPEARCTGDHSCSNASSTLLTSHTLSRSYLADVWLLLALLDQLVGALAAAPLREARLSPLCTVHINFLCSCLALPSCDPTHTLKLRVNYFCHMWNCKFVLIFLGKIYIWLRTLFLVLLTNIAAGISTRKNIHYLSLDPTGQRKCHHLMEHIHCRQTHMKPTVEFNSQIPKAALKLFTLINPQAVFNQSTGTLIPLCSRNAFSLCLNQMQKKLKIEFKQLIWKHRENAASLILWGYILARLVLKGIREREREEQMMRVDGLRESTWCPQSS